MRLGSLQDEGRGSKIIALPGEGNLRGNSQFHFLISGYYSLSNKEQM